MDRAHLRQLGQHLDQALAVEALAGGGDELHERLAGVPALAHDEMAEVALLRGLVEGDEPLLARPGAHAVADRVAEVGREPAAVDLEHLVPPPRAVEAERRAVLGLRERVLELVAVAELLDGGDDLLERRVGEPGEALQRVADPLLLRGELRRVGEILEAAAAAGREVGARRDDALGPRRQDVGDDRLGVAALHLRHARANRVARQAAAGEDDEAVEAPDAVPAEGERVDRELELLVSLNGRRHAWKVAGATEGR